MGSDKSTTKIAIGGMIASGKSTLVKSLAKDLEYQYLMEFSEDDDVFKTMLKWLYEGKQIELQLQTFFIEKHFDASKKYKDINHIVDRDLIEHCIFAQKNIENPIKMAAYEILYRWFLLNTNQPDLYIILSVDWENFKNRIKKRGRKEEIENFDINKNYFKSLIDNYDEKLIYQCKVNNIPYHIIDTNHLNIKQVHEEALKAVREMIRD